MIMKSSIFALEVDCPPEVLADFLKDWDLKYAMMTCFHMFCNPYPPHVISRMLHRKALSVTLRADGTCK
jgi:hypothetical protein